MFSGLLIKYDLINTKEENTRKRSLCSISSLFHISKAEFYLLYQAQNTVYLSYKKNNASLVKTGPKTPSEHYVFYCKDISII